MRTIKGILATTMFLLSGCTSQMLEDYKDKKPEIAFKEFFNGHINAWGIFQDYTGKVVKHFTLKMRGEWDNNKCKLHETFHWSDGKTSERLWEVDLITPTQFTARASDAVGEGTGKSVGNAMQWSYRLKVPVDGKTYEFDFDDWFYAVDSKVIVNKAKMKKFGFTVGEVTLFMQKD